MLSSRLCLCGLLIAALAGAPAHADKRERDHDAVRIAVERGEIKPLAEILAQRARQLPGDIAGVEIERETAAGSTFRVVDTKGRLFEAHVDGKSGEIERIKEK